MADILNISCSDYEDINDDEKIVYCKNNESSSEMDINCENNIDENDSAIDNEINIEDDIECENCQDADNENCMENDEICNEDDVSEDEDDKINIILNQSKIYPIAKKRQFVNMFTCNICSWYSVHTCFIKHTDIRIQKNNTVYCCKYCDYSVLHSNHLPKQKSVNDCQAKLLDIQYSCCKLNCLHICAPPLQKIEIKLDYIMLKDKTKKDNIYNCKQCGTIILHEICENYGISYNRPYKIPLTGRIFPNLFNQSKLSLKNREVISNPSSITINRAACPNQLKLKTSRRQLDGHPRGNANVKHHQQLRQTSQLSQVKVYQRRSSEPKQTLTLAEKNLHHQRQSLVENHRSIRKNAADIDHRRQGTQNHLPSTLPRNIKNPDIHVGVQDQVHHQTLRLEHQRPHRLNRPTRNLVSQQRHRAHHPYIVRDDQDHRHPSGQNQTQDLQKQMNQLLIQVMKLQAQINQQGNQ